MGSMLIIAVMLVLCCGAARMLKMLAALAKPYNH